MTLLWRGIIVYFQFSVISLVSSLLNIQWLKFKNNFKKEYFCEMHKIYIDNIKLDYTKDIIKVKVFIPCINLFSYIFPIFSHISFRFGGNFCIILFGINSIFHRLRNISHSFCLSSLINFNVVIWGVLSAEFYFYWMNLFFQISAVSDFKLYYSSSIKTYIAFWT